jgi:hypothetical protein
VGVNSSHKAFVIQWNHKESSYRPPADLRWNNFFMEILHGDVLKRLCSKTLHINILKKGEIRPSMTKPRDVARGRLGRMEHLSVVMRSSQAVTQQVVRQQSFIMP